MFEVEVHSRAGIGCCRIRIGRTLLLVDPNVRGRPTLAVVVLNWPTCATVCEPQQSLMLKHAMWTPPRQPLPSAWHRR